MAETGRMSFARPMQALGRPMQRLARLREEGFHHNHTASIDSVASSTIMRPEILDPTNLVELDSLMAAAPKHLVDCQSIEVLREGGTLKGSADLNLHPLEHADALLSAQEAFAPRYGIRAFHDASKDGRRHALMLPVDAIVKGLNQAAIHDPLLEGWMGVSPSELARYMLWSGYDTLLLQQVPVLQSFAGLGRWKQLETFVEAFARSWENEAQGFLAEARNPLRGVSMEGDIDSRTSQTPGASQRFGIETPRRAGDEEQGRSQSTTTVNPMMAVFNSIGGAGKSVAGREQGSGGNAGLWPLCIRVHTANVLVENGDAFVHHAFMSRDVEKPWWFSLKGIVMRNRHLDVKGLFSHSYASDVYTSRINMTTFIEGYVEDERVEEVESTIKETKSLWALPRVYRGSKDIGRGRRLAMYAVEEVDVSVSIDPIEPPAAFRRVVVGEEFNETDLVIARPFSPVDIGFFLTVMQTKSIPALVCFSLPPALNDMRIFREKQEPISLVQYLSHPIFAEFEPNMPRVARGEDSSEKLVPRSTSGATPNTARGNKGVRWADQEVDKEAESGLDPMACPNLDAFLDAVANERKRTGAAEWSVEGEEEGDWIEAVVEHLRAAKREAARIARVKAAAEAASRPASGRLFGSVAGGEGVTFTPAEVAALAAEASTRGVRDVPEWIQQQLPGLLRVLEAARLLVHCMDLVIPSVNVVVDGIGCYSAPLPPFLDKKHLLFKDPTLLKTMVEATARVEKKPRNRDPTLVGQTTPGRSRTPITPNRSRQNPTTPTSNGRTPKTPRGMFEEDDPELIRTYEEEALPLHWQHVEQLGQTDSLQVEDGEPEAVEDQLFSTYLEYSVGQPRLGTQSSLRAKSVVLNNVQWLINTASLSPLHFDTERCGPVKSDLFKSILAKFAAFTSMLQYYLKRPRDKEPDAEGEDDGETKAAVHVLLAWVNVAQIYSCMSGIAAAGGASPTTSVNPALSQGPPPMAIEVYSVEKHVLAFTGKSKSEEYFGFHSLYKETNEGSLAIYVTKEHENQAAGVLWCYLKHLGLPVMLCHLAECLMDRALDCRWDPEQGEDVFRTSATREGAMRIGYLGKLRPLKFVSETCKMDIERDLPILERACLLRMLAHGHACLTEYTAAGAGEAKSRSELAACFRIVSAWRLHLVQNLRNMPSNRYLYKFEDHLRLPSLTIHGAIVGHRGVDPRRMLWWTWLAMPWSPSARTAIINLLTVISRAPAPKESSSSEAADKAMRAKVENVVLSKMGPSTGGAALAGQGDHGALWKLISDLFVTRLGTCMLMRSLVLENRNESPYPPNEKHYHMVALELRGADKTAVFDYLRTDPCALGDVLNRIVRTDCLASDHSHAFLASKTLGTLHNVKHGKSGSEPVWLETGYGGRLRRLRDSFLAPKDSPAIHGYSAGIYYSMPVFIELLLQLTSGGVSSVYTNPGLGNYETVVPIALLHSLVVFGGLSLGAAKISSVNFFSFMVIKLVLAQIQFLTVLIVASVVLFPFISGGALALWSENPLLALTFVFVFFTVGAYIMLVSLLLSTTGGKPWTSNSGRILLLGHALLLVSPALIVVGTIPEGLEGPSFVIGVVMLMLVLVVGFTYNTRRLYNMTLSKQTLTLTANEWKTWEAEHKNHPDAVGLFYKKVSSSLTAWQHPLTRKRRFGMMDDDLEQFLLGFDAIRNSQTVPDRWCKQWDDRLKRGHDALVAVNRGAGVETASTIWAVVKWDVFYGASYFFMVFSDNMVSIWTEKKIVESDEISMLALALFIIATAGLESMMMINLGRSNGWRFWRMDSEFLSMSEASRSVSKALHRLYLWDFITYICFVIFCILLVGCLGYFWLLPGYAWNRRSILRAVSLVTGYVGILFGLFHKILFGGSVSRQKAAVKVAVTALAAGYSAGLGIMAANAYLHFSEESLAYSALGFTGFIYAVYSMITYAEFRVQLTSQGFASGQLLSTPSLGTAGQRRLGVATLHLDGKEARAVESCRSASKGRILTQMENRALIQRTLFEGKDGDPGSLWSRAPNVMHIAFGNKVPRNEDFFRWTITPVPDRCIVDHGLNALVDPEQDDLLYVAETVYADREAFAECLMHETYEWAYGSHQVGVLSELLIDPLPSRMRRQIAAEYSSLPLIIDRTLPCTVDIMSMGCLKNEMFWRDLSPHAREVVLRMLLTQQPTHFKHHASDDPEAPMVFSIGSGISAAGTGGDSTAEHYNDLVLAMSLGCRNGNVLLTAMEEASLGLDPQVAVARASLLAGLSQCVMRFALAHASANTNALDVTDPTSVSQLRPPSLRRPSVGHLQGRQRVWGAMVQTHSAMNQETVKNIRLSNSEALLNQMETVFPTSGAFHLDYMLFGAASGCMGFDREAFALMLDQNPRSLSLFIKMHRVSRWLHKWLLHRMVLKTDAVICELIKSIDTATLGGNDVDLETSPSESDKGAATGNASGADTGGGGRDGVRVRKKHRIFQALVGDSPRTELSEIDLEYGCRRLIQQRQFLEDMIRNQDLPIAFSMWFDERVLRQEPLLEDYWAARDRGQFSEALVSLKLVQDQLAGGLATGFPAALSTYEDLATFAQCGTTIGMMKADRDGDPASLRRGPGTWATNIKAAGGVTVMTLDSGTWPLYGGGVSVCRKQLLDDTVGRVRWNTLFEVALPAAVPKNVDTPPNIRQMMPIPLWSQNAGGAYETYLAHTSFITRSLRVARTTPAAIDAFFIPQLKTLIDLANTPGDAVSLDGLDIAAQAVAEIYCYFQVFDWDTTWKAGTTHDHWAASWLACAARDKQAGPLLNSEKPNLAELHEILNYWQTLLTCLQVQLPEMNDDNRGVVHTSHHGTQALVGVAARRLLGWSLVVWDHGMLWRERCKAIAELHGSSLFVRKSLISLYRLVAKVTLYEADALTPCTQMNKPWELRAVAERDSEVRDLIDRKVNPVLNGAPASIKPNNFQPGLNADNKNEFVTVVMLSHVYALKGVLTAIMAADVIINRYGLKKYRILIYGSTTHDVVYCRRCQDTIDRLKLNDNVKLMGKGRPAAVLAQGDMFLNSSVSEGLPLAIIEASRAGLVVVATDVGGTRDVVSEFGGICRPNSPVELAKTQLETLAACEKWCKIAGAPNLKWAEIDLSPSPGEILEKAIFSPDVINARHAWGSRYLEWTSKAFTLNRYRDEHVRALWFADRQAQENLARLTLNWGPDPGHRRLALAYLRLRRLLEVADRKEHTTLSFIASFAEVRSRINDELRCRTPMDLATDRDQLALMSAFQANSVDLPILQWLHGGNIPWDEGDDDREVSPERRRYLSRAGSESFGSLNLQPIEESEQEEPAVRPIVSRTFSSGSSFATPRLLESKLGVGVVGASGPAPKGAPKVRPPADPSAAGRVAQLSRKSSLGDASPAVVPSRPAGGQSVPSHLAKGFPLDGTAVASWNKGQVGLALRTPLRGGHRRTVSHGSDGKLQSKLDKLAEFERLDRELFRRTGVHLNDIGDLGTPSLVNLLRKNAPSPATHDADEAPATTADGSGKAAETTGASEAPDPLVAGISELIGTDILSTKSKTSMHDWLTAVQAEVDEESAEMRALGADQVGEGDYLMGATPTGYAMSVASSAAASGISAILVSSNRRYFPSSAMTGAGPKSTDSVPVPPSPSVAFGSISRTSRRFTEDEDQGYFPDHGTTEGADSPAASGLSSVAPWHNSQGTDAASQQYLSNIAGVDMEDPARGKGFTSSGGVGGGAPPGSGRSGGVDLLGGRSFEPSPIHAARGDEAGGLQWGSNGGGEARLFMDDECASDYSAVVAAHESMGRAPWDSRSGAPPSSAGVGFDGKASLVEKEVHVREEVNHAVPTRPFGMRGHGRASSMGSIAHSWTSVWKDMTTGASWGQRADRGDGELSRSSSKVSTGDPNEFPFPSARQGFAGDLSGADADGGSKQSAATPIMSSATSLLCAGMNSKARPVEQVRPRRRSQMQLVMHRVEDMMPQAAESVPAKVNSERLRQYQGLVDDAASSRGGVSGGSEAAAGDNLGIPNSEKGVGLSGSTLGAPSNAVPPDQVGAPMAKTPRNMPPELERPLPFALDVLANQSDSKWGAKKKPNSSSRSEDPRTRERQPVTRERLEEAAARFALHDSEDETDDDAFSPHC